MGKREIKSVLKTRPGICYICRRRGDTALHHCFFGAANRWMSDENGFVVFLCPSCHTESPTSAHKCRDTDLYLKRSVRRHTKKTTQGTSLCALWDEIT
nr:MAG TPA: Recombination enhancement, RecA-dependent nuclease [Caudoviricetes sp.]